MSLHGSVEILHVEDNPQFAELVGDLLEDERDVFEVVTETDASNVLSLLEDGSIDCIVSDYEMPEMDGLELLERVRAEYPELPFILFTGKGTESVASNAISKGVTDYLQKEGTKDQFTVLANRIENAVTQREQERQFETLVDNLPGMVYRCRDDEGWPFEFVGGEVQSLTEYTSAQIMDEEFSWETDVVHQDDRETVRNEIQKQLEEDGSFELRYRIRTRDADVRWVWERGRAVETTPDGTTILEGFIADISDLKGRERELEQQQTINRTLIENLPVGVLVEDETRTILASNAKLGEILGVELLPDELVGRDCGRAADELKHVFEDSEQFVESIVRHLESREPVFDEEFTLEDGRIIERTYVPYELPDGNASLWVYEDVTEQREREQLTRGLFEASIDGIGVKEIVTDESGEPVDYIYKDVNERFEELTGLTAENVVGNRATDVIDGIEETPFIEIFGEVALEGTTKQFEQYSEPLDRHYEVSAFSHRDGEVITIFSDITDRKERERELERYKHFIEHSPDITVVLDDEMTVRYQSPLSPVESSDLLQVRGENPLEYIHPEDIATAVDDLQSVLDNPDHIARTEFRAEDANGNYRWFESRTQNFLNSEPIDGILLTIRDVTERKEQQQQLERQKDRLDEFASFVSHDLRNPLNVASLRTDLASQECDSEHLTHVQQALVRMEELIENLLALARQGMTIGDREDVALSALCERCWSTVETRDATLAVQTTATVQADTDRLANAIENLVRNAVEHGGEDVTVTVGDLPDGNGFYIEDDGPGIPEENRKNVFESGYSDTDSGTGFGLAIVREIVQAHDWEISVTDGEDGGARFEITTAPYTDGRTS